MEKVNWTQLKLAFVPPQSEILGGSVEIIIGATSGTARKHFGIPRQISATNGTFYATNSVSP